MGGDTNLHFMQAADCSYNFNHFIFLPKIQIANKQPTVNAFIFYYSLNLSIMLIHYYNRNSERTK